MLFPKNIIDGHAHVASTRFLPISFLKGLVDNTLNALNSAGIATSKTKVLDGYLNRMQDHECLALLQEMDAAEVEKTVLLCPDFTFVCKDSELTIEEMYEHHKKILASNKDRFIVFAGVDPRWGDDGITLFERGVKEMGFLGLKLYPPCGYSPSDKEMNPYYEICRERNIPVLFHTGGTSPALDLNYASPMYVEDAARRFPDVNFIIAHGTTTYYEESIMLCTCRPNVYMDISAFQSMPISMLDSIFSRNINHKIIFGTDWPVFRNTGTLKSHIETLLDKDGALQYMNDHEILNFFGNTISRLIYSGKKVEDKNHYQTEKSKLG